MKWIKKDNKGNPQVWYSQDVILRIREWATAGILHYKYDAKGDSDACETIIKFLNEVDDGENNS